MSANDDDSPPRPGSRRTTRSQPRRVRREPPRFRRVAVRRAEPLSGRLLRMTLAGDELDGLVVEQPAASVRLLLPAPGTAELVMPAWNGNEFLLADGSRPVLRTLTPRHVDAAARELDVDIVLHGGGAAESWAMAARPGDPVAVSGPGRGYDLDPDVPALLLAGDETALPAIGQLLEHVAAVLPGVPVQVHVEVARPDARLDLLPPAADASATQDVRDHVTVTWYDLPEGAPPGDALVAAVKAAELVTGERVWAAGEAAAVQRIRRHLFAERDLPREHAHVRGYWKHGVGGE